MLAPLRIPTANSRSRDCGTPQREAVRHEIVTVYPSSRTQVIQPSNSGQRWISTTFSTTKAAGMWISSASRTLHSVARLALWADLETLLCTRAGWPALL